MNDGSLMQMLKMRMVPLVSAFFGIAHAASLIAVSTIEVSSETDVDSWGKEMMVDGDTGTFYHSTYDTNPKWVKLILDEISQHTVNQVSVVNR